MFPVFIERGEVNKLHSGEFPDFIDAFWGNGTCCHIYNILDPLGRIMTVAGIF